MDRRYFLKPSGVVPTASLGVLSARQTSATGKTEAKASTSSSLHASRWKQGGASTLIPSRLTAFRSRFSFINMDRKLSHVPSLARNCKAGGCETFEDCLPMALSDFVNAELHWKSGQLKDVVGRIVRLEVSLRHAKLFAIRGTLHFIDAQDKWMIEDGKLIAI